MTESTFNKLPAAFPEANIASLKITKARAEFLAAFKPVAYHCCPKSCLCYVGPHADKDSCDYCKEPRYDAQGKPRKTFTYIPLIPRLTAFYSNLSMIDKLRYRAAFISDPTKVQDVMDGTHYQQLRSEYVTIDGKRQSFKFFGDWRDIALGFSTDGFAPFKRRKQTCWPLIFYNYNLPPDIRFLLQYILCVGVVPGPYKPKDFDSFFWPAAVELLRLAKGVSAFDLSTSEIFILRAYLILIFGDMPAVSMMMHMKGANGIHPCRACKIRGLRTPNSRATTHYVPLDRSCHPAVRNDPTLIRKYDPSSLPLRTHDEIIAQAKYVELSRSFKEADRRSKEVGINGTSIFFCLSSLRFPTSFPHDFMHLIFENGLDNLIELWTTDFKGIDTSSDDFRLSPKIWDAIGSATAAAGSTIPSAFGARPPNVATNNTAKTAETKSFWGLYIGPALLARRFKKKAYYTHFVEFVRLISLCMEFELSRNQVKDIRNGFQVWVEQYEKYDSFFLS